MFLFNVPAIFFFNSHLERHLSNVDLDRETGGGENYIKALEVTVFSPHVLLYQSKTESSFAGLRFATKRLLLKHSSPIFTMKYSVCRILCIALLSTTLFDFSSGFFPNTLNGFLQDIQNPSSLLALLMLKYWLLVSSGAITFTGAAIGKRSVPSTAPPFSTDDFYAMVLSKVDNEQCIPRLICLTLGSRRDAKAQAGSNFERKILQTFGEKPLPDSLSYPKSPGFIYKYAAYIGRYASTPEACKQLFPKCKQNMTELQKMANLIFDSRL